LRDWGLSLLWLLLFAAPIVFSGATTEAFEYPKIALLKAAALVFLAGAAVLARPRIPPDPLAWGVLASWAVAAVSTLVSVHPRTSLLGAEGSFAGLLTLSGYAVLFFAARGLCVPPERARTVLAGAVGGAGVAIAYGIAQLAGFDPLRWRAPITVSEVARVFSTQGHPNSLAQLLALAWPVAVYLGVRAVHERRWDGVVGCALVTLGGPSLTLLTLSRAGVAAIGAAFLVLCCGAAWRLAPARRVPALLGLLGMLGLGVALAWSSEEGSRRTAALWQRLTDSTDAGVEHDPRGFQWAGAWAVFRERALLGVGLDCFALAFAERRSAAAWVSEWGLTPLKAHNQPLEVLATRGLLGGAAALLVVYGVIRALVSALGRREHDPFLALACFAGLSAFGVHTLFHFPTAAGTAIAAALGAILSRLAEESPSPPQTASLPAARTVLAAALLLPALALGVLVPLRADSLCRAGSEATPRDPALAVALLEQSVRLDASRSLPWQRLAAAYQATARVERDASARVRSFERARRAALEAVARQPGAHAQLGAILSDLEREQPPLAARADVERAYEAARQRDPANSFVHTAAAAAALAAGDPDGATRWAERCLSLYPDFAPPRALLGAASLALGRQSMRAGDREGARAGLERAVRQLGEALAANWRGDREARAAAEANRYEAMRELAELD
jgi:O-antigen ligase